MIKTLLKNAWAILSARASLWWLCVLLPFFALIPFDDAALASWRFPEGGSVHRFAQLISQRGDFYNGCLILVVAFFAAGWFWKRPQWKLLALAMLFACASAGILSLTFRVLSGRPRPALNVPDGLYGPRLRVGKGSFVFFDYDYQSFPSGHATTAFATAVPALIAAPAVGVPLLAAAVTVSWARFQLNRHRLSDLYAGMLFGSLFGAAFGLAVRRTAKPHS